MADRHHADLPEILGRQAGQHPFVDLVGAERRLVLLEPETAEPCRNVHARLPDAVTAFLPYPKLSPCTNTRWGCSWPGKRRAIGIARYGENPGKWEGPLEIALGLSISWDIVTQQHGGSIEVDSEPGEFTEFTIRLPRNGQAARTSA